MDPLTDEERRARRAHASRLQRRRRRTAAGILLGVAAAVAVVVVLLAGGGSSPSGSDTAASTTQTSANGAGRASGAATRRAEPARIKLGPIPPSRPGRAEVVQRGPAAGRMVALTFDDGFCAACVTTLVRQLERTGAHATLFPNGTYGRSWSSHRDAIRAMVARGQVTVGSHTFSHVNAPAVGADAFAADLDRNERWIEETFGLTGRPYLRPPYGAYDAGTLAAAGRLGYTKVVTWSGTVADSNLRSKAYILNAIRYWARPGAIILLHANYPPTAEALPQIVEILRRKRLRTATLQELIGGSPYKLPAAG